MQAVTTWTDSHSGNEFALQQAVGLPPGERALVFLKSPKFGQRIPAGQWLCGYSDDTRALRVDEWNECEASAMDAYAVAAKKDVVVLPNSLEPNEHNLGLFANAALPIDPLRLKPNARLLCAFGERWPQGVRISLRTLKPIRAGDEVLISYGAGYSHRLQREIKQRQAEEAASLSNTTPDTMEC